ncbi:hypothetical protein VHEMI06191 [[Torrubiella] hemipterigena]|uniref:DUF7962 domain-containing protein n=1 Tax=[Torrubiella] hemipterigena TaxID=1531966 RepID=A0A0A1TIU1_9HYPO|nr:hypothetical protein VHEMI06191 [[Torrubiella] hemipterigena]
MPRPELEDLGIAHRRIPILSIGRDVYVDTRLIFAKLDELKNYPAITPTTPEHALIMDLLSEYITDAGVFTKIADILLASDAPIAQDPAFIKDREDLLGHKIAKEDHAQMTSSGLIRLQEFFGRLENTILSDGRIWLFNTPSPTRGDIEGIWPALFLAGMDGVLPEDKFSPKIFPKVYAWIQRFKSMVDAATAQAPEIKSLNGAGALASVTGTDYHDELGSVDPTDFDVAAFGIKAGDTVSFGPLDYGCTQRDKGKLLSLNAQEVVLDVATKNGSSIRLHAPRHGFQLRKE